MDYYKIGQRIRKYRKALSLSQEQLAEKVGISVTHMSHIETGNTKLSLPVLAELSRALEVQVDDLLYDHYFERQKTENEILQMLDACNEKQLRVLTDILRAAKASMDKYL